MLDNYLSRPVFGFCGGGTREYYLLRANPVENTASVCQRIQHWRYEDTGKRSKFNRKIWKAIAVGKRRWTYKPMTVALSDLFETRKEALEAFQAHKAARPSYHDLFDAGAHFVA